MVHFFELWLAAGGWGFSWMKDCGLLWHSSPRFRTKTRKSMAEGEVVSQSPLSGSTLPSWLRSRTKRSQWLCWSGVWNCTSSCWQQSGLQGSSDLPLSTVFWYTQLPNAYGKSVLISPLLAGTVLRGETYHCGALCSVLSRQREPAAPAQKLILSCLPQFLKAWLMNLHRRERAKVMVNLPSWKLWWNDDARIVLG